MAVIQDLDSVIGEGTILFFDMDGTLVDTNLANYLAYKKAIQSVRPSIFDVQYDPGQRMNRGTLKSIIQDLTDQEYEKIIEEKEKFYESFLPETKLNETVVNILMKYYHTNRTVLVTNCRKNRATTILTYHNLTDKFTDTFFRCPVDNGIRINKYEKAILSLEILAQSVIVFENEKREMNDATLAGIPVENILKFGV